MLQLQQTHERMPFQERFPQATPTALSVLGSMLQFSPPSSLGTTGTSTPVLEEGGAAWLGKLPIFGHHVGQNFRAGCD